MLHTTCGKINSTKQAFSDFAIHDESTHELFLHNLLIIPRAVKCSLRLGSSALLDSTKYLHNLIAEKL